MFTIALNVMTLQCLAEFIALYLGESPALEEIEAYVELKLQEKDVATSYSCDLITKDELCAFITAHLFTKFIQGREEVLEVEEEKLNAVNEKLKGLLFVS